MAVMIISGFLTRLGPDNPKSRGKGRVEGSGLPEDSRNSKPPVASRLVGFRVFMDSLDFT